MHVFSWRIFSPTFPFKTHIDHTRFRYPSLLLTNCLGYIFGKVTSAEASYKLALARELNKIIKGVMEHNRGKCLENIEQMLRMEEKVFTVNPYYMAIFKRIQV